MPPLRQTGPNPAAGIHACEIITCAQLSGHSPERHGLPGLVVRGTMNVPFTAYFEYAARFLQIGALVVQVLVMRRGYASLDGLLDDMLPEAGCDSLGSKRWGRGPTDGVSSPQFPLRPQPLRLPPLAFRSTCGGAPSDPLQPSRW